MTLNIRRRGDRAKPYSPLFWLAYTVYELSTVLTAALSPYHAKCHV